MFYPEGVVLYVEKRLLVALTELEKSFEEANGEDFVLFRKSNPMQELQRNGLRML